MIGYLRGEILESQEGKLLLAVSAGEAAIGYAVTVPQSPAYLGFEAGRKAELHIHSHIREDAFDLYGFATRAEKELFLTLLSVNGIGPKVAMGILSKVDPATLVDAILSGDRDALTQIPGIGKKTAERVVLELADPLRKKAESGAIKGQGKASQARPAAPFREAKEALLGLGYREQDVTATLNQVLEHGPAPKVEDLIRTALQRLS